MAYTKQRTQKELELLEQFVLDKRIIADTSELGLKQAEHLWAYFDKWGVEITPDTLTRGYEQLRPHLKHYTEIEARAIRAAQSNPGIVAAFDEWFNRQNILAKEPNSQEANENIALLLEELRGRQVNETTIHQAIGRLQTKGANLHWTLKKQIHVDPRSHKASDDGKPFLGEVNVPMWKKVAAERERQDAERKRLTGQQESANAAQASAKAACEVLQGATHSETERLRRIFVLDSNNNVNWAATLTARQQASSQDNRSIR